MGLLQEIIRSMQISSVLFRWDIFAALCGKKLNQKSLIKTIKGKKSSASLAKIAGRKISGRKPYKVKIRAYRFVDGRNVNSL